MSHVTPWTKRIIIVGLLVLAGGALYLKEMEVVSLVAGGLLAVIRSDKLEAIDGHDRSGPH